MKVQSIFTRSGLCLLGLLGLTLFVSPVAAQVFDSGPSDSALFDNVINIPADSDIGFFSSIGGDGLTTQLNLSSGGSIVGFFEADSGSEVNINDGTVGDGFDANSGSEVNISGGSFGSSFSANSGSVVNICGGNFGFFVAFSGSVVSIRGGTLGLFSGSDSELIGGEFQLNNQAFSGSTITIGVGDIFTGTLADGSPFIFRRAPFSSFELQSNRISSTVVSLELIGLVISGK